MRLLLVLICLQISRKSLASFSGPHYVITVPANLHHGTVEKACVTLLDLKGEVDLNIDLNNNDHIHNVAQLKINTEDYTQCHGFQVPKIKDSHSIWLLHVTARGENINVNESKKVVIIKTEDLCVIQTDKSRYKPGDTVTIRLMTVNHNLQVINKQYPVVEIIDINRNRMAQWLNVSTTQGFADLSLHLASEVVLGGYEINVPNSCNNYFQVDEYVPKRFELHLDLPARVFLTDESFHLEACGSYNNGKPVKGKINLSVCEEDDNHEEPQPFSYHKTTMRNCIHMKGEKTDNKGCIYKDIQIGDFYFSPLEKDRSLKIDSDLREDVTGHSEKVSDVLHLRLPRKTVTFVECDHFYHKGFPYHGKVKVNDEKNQPIANEVITIYVPIYTPQSEGMNHVRRVRFVTDSNGIAKFALNTSDWQLGLHLKVGLQSNDQDEDDRVYYDFQPESLEDLLWLSPFYSKTESVLFLEKHSKDLSCNSDHSVSVKYDIQKNSLNSGTYRLHFFYVLLTKNGIFSYKEHQINIKDQGTSPNIHGSFPLNFQVDPDFAPAFSLLVFTILPNGETIAKSTMYNVSPCIQNKVKLRFSEKQVRPGESVNLEVTAEAGSLCSVRSVDKGYLLWRPHDDSSLLTDATNLLKDSIQKNTYTHLIEEDPDVHQCPENTTAQPVHRPDVYSLFKLNHLQIFTNTEINSPVNCVPRYISGRSLAKKKKKTKHRDIDQKIRQKMTRSYFPDTWLFELVPMGSDGETVLNRTTPHSITKWVTDAFCLSNTGVAIVRDVELTTFQPYFIDLIVPYSVVQGERFIIQTVVFSYVKKCILIVISLSNSDQLVVDKEKEKMKCVCEGHSHVFSWQALALKPKTLRVHVESSAIEVDGECSSVAIRIEKHHRQEKIVVVKPKEYEEKKIKTFLLLPKEIREEISFTIKAPERLKSGSEQAHIVIMGDLMANVVVNMNDIIYLPDGCGEQNIAKKARYVYTLDYLESVQEVKPYQKARIIEALKKGYQKQLTFKTENGSYGGSDNIWLTALVVKVFREAQKYIFIDENHIQQCANWLYSKQHPDGCFRERGDYFNNYLEGDDHIARTAYITIALLEHDVVYNGSIVEDALRCLRKSMDSDTSVYTQALLAYTFTLSGDHEFRDQILKKLDDTAVMKDGAKHWGTAWVLEGETASHVVLALLCKKITTMKDLEASGDIVLWIVKHQDQWGGFHSSQDTNVALQALAKFAKAINHKKGDTIVTIKSKSGFQNTIYVDKSPGLHGQTFDLPEIPGEYSISAMGDGFVYLQSHLHYHVLPEQREKGH